MHEACTKTRTSHLVEVLYFNLYSFGLKSPLVQAPSQVTFFLKKTFSVGILGTIGTPSFHPTWAYLTKYFCEFSCSKFQKTNQNLI